ncbi:hypothetical protein SDC9_169949 [bioreactor metagenome]|uniref:Uncharacterized protein n=1 Tax=bioreactor metagenome TaxID=1076179 RepID=A0A645G8X2_9ZZZZ
MKARRAPVGQGHADEPVHGVVGKAHRNALGAVDALGARERDEAPRLVIAVVAAQPCRVLRENAAVFVTVDEQGAFVGRAQADQFACGAVLPCGGRLRAHGARHAPSVAVEDVADQRAAIALLLQHLAPTVVLDPGDVACGVGHLREQVFRRPLKLQLATTRVFDLAGKIGLVMRVAKARGAVCGVGDGGDAA